MKNILVATDFSPKAEMAAKVGIALAAQFKAEIHFLHVFHTPVNWSKLPKQHEARFPEVKAAIGSAKAKLTSLRHSAAEKGLDASTFISFDHENMNVLQHIQTHKHDLVVIGSHSRLTLTDVLFGSVAVDIIQRSTVPVLLVDGATDFKEVSSVLIAVDPLGKPINMIQEVSKLFPTEKVAIKAFSVSAESGTIGTAILEALTVQVRKQTGPNVTYETVFSEKEDHGIIEKANSNEGSLLVVGSNRFNSIADYLRGHVFPSIAGRIKIPLLILK